MNNVSSTETIEVSQLLTVARDIEFYSMAGIVPMGLIFNTVSVIVFMSRRMRKRAASLYLASLAISDNIALLTFTFDTWLTDDRIGFQLNHPFCLIFTHLSYASRLFSAILITSFTIERFVSVVYPLKRQALASTTHACKVILAEMVVSLMATSFTLFTMGVMDSDEPHRPRECDVIESRSIIYIALNVPLVICGSIVIPIIVICSLNSFILYKIWQRKKAISKSNKHRSGMRYLTGTTRSYNIATMLLVVSTSFVVLNLPYCLSWGILFFKLFIREQKLDQNLYAAKLITTVPYYLNYAINLLLYNMCARAFRVQMVRVLCIFKRVSYVRQNRNTHRMHYGPTARGRTGAKVATFGMTSQSSDTRECGAICHKMLTPFTDTLPHLRLCGAQHVSSATSAYQPPPRVM